MVCYVDLNFLTAITKKEQRTKIKNTLILIFTSGEDIYCRKINIEKNTPIKHIAKYKYFSLADSLTEVLGSAPIRREVNIKINIFKK